MKKVCTQCKLELDTSLFALRKDRTSGLSSWCRECKNKYRQSDKQRELLRQYEKTEKYRMIKRAYRKTEKAKEYSRESKRIKYHNNINFKLAELLRARLHNALSGKTKRCSAIANLGCTIPELKQHLEGKFKKGMTWNNHGKWHIDHIKPLGKFDLADKKQVLMAVHYSNLQPLWAFDNISKGVS